jgi:hypothetical protein
MGIDFIAKRPFALTIPVGARGTLIPPKLSHSRPAKELLAKTF